MIVGKKLYICKNKGMKKHIPINVDKIKCSPDCNYENGAVKLFWNSRSFLLRILLSFTLWFHYIQGFEQLLQ